MAFSVDPRLPAIEAAGQQLSFPTGTTLQQQLEAVLPTLGFNTRDAENIARRSANAISRDLRAGKLVNLPGFVQGVTPGGLELTAAEEKRRQARVVPRPSAGLDTASAEQAFRQLLAELGSVQEVQRQPIVVADELAAVIARATAREAEVRAQITTLQGAT